MKFFNYGRYSEDYSKLKITKTYYLAFRDIPQILHKLVNGKKALDYGCGTGRSTRFLKKLGFEVIGVDINEKMLEKAKRLDKEGCYSHIKSANLDLFENNFFDLIFCAFIFDSIPSKIDMIKILKEFRKKLKSKGAIIIITSTPELYFHNWASFISNFPENKNTRAGDKVRIHIKGTNIKVFDYLWYDGDYKSVFQKSNLRVIKGYKPLANGTEKYKWINEKKIPPWFVYVLNKQHYDTYQTENNV